MKTSLGTTINSRESEAEREIAAASSRLLIVATIATRTATEETITAAVEAAAGIAEEAVEAAAAENIVERAMVEAAETIASAVDPIEEAAIARRVATTIEEETREAEVVGPDRTPLDLSAARDLGAAAVANGVLHHRHPRRIGSPPRNRTLLDVKIDG